MSDALKKSLTDARVLLERVLVGAAASVVVSLGVAIVDHLAAAIMLAGLLGFCLLLALSIANKVGDLAEVSALGVMHRGANRRTGAKS